MGGPPARPRPFSTAPRGLGERVRTVFRRPGWSLCHDGRMVPSAVTTDMTGVRILVWTSSSNVTERVWHAVRHFGADVVAVDQHSVPTQLGEGVEVLVIDRSISNWLRAVSDVVEREPSLRPMLIGDLDGPDEFLAAISAGVVGFCPRLATTGAIERSIRSVAETGVAIPRSFAKPLVDLARRGRFVRTRAGDVAVTDREWEILQLVVQRRTTQQIAQALFVSAGTVRSHISSLLKKFGAYDRDDMVSLMLGDQEKHTP